MILEFVDEDEEGPEAEPGYCRGRRLCVGKDSILEKMHMELSGV